MSRGIEKSQAVFQRAKELMPMGVTSNYRYLGDQTRIIERAEGAYLWDADGNRLIDYRMAFGPVILGHAHPVVNQRVSEAISQGTLFGHTHELELKVAERVVRMCPGVDKIRFANSGTEATLHAIRFARGYTGRDRILKFEGHYHGMHNDLYWSTGGVPLRAVGPSKNPLPVVMSAGIPRGLSQYLTVAPYNDIEALDRIVRAQWGDLAVIVLDPLPVCGIMPDVKFLKHVRALCDEFGIVMMVDEVKSGFRLAKGGANEYFGVSGDLMTYAKGLANGFPAAVIGGRAEVMDAITPGGVAHGGTYNGNVVATAAADATLEILETTDALDRIHKLGKRLMDGIHDVLTEAGIDHVVDGHPAMFGFVVGHGKRPLSYRNVMASDTELYKRIALKMLDLDIEYDSDLLEQLFVSASHTDADIDETLNKFNDAVKSAK